jgi:hypothetical protein
MTKKTYTSSDLRKMTQLKAVVHDPRYEIVPIVSGGEFLYDPQVFWNWDENSPWAEPKGSILISDIGGQPQPETDWTMGHGAIFRLRADDSWETIMAPGVGRQAGVFRPIIAPQGWGEWGGHIFFGSQIIPHRRGAVVDHMLYRLGPDDDRPHGFCVVPRAGTRDRGISGALLPGVFGRRGTPEEGLLLIFSMHNCTIYAVQPNGSIEPWLIMDGVSGPGPVMPYRLFYADPQLVGETDVLVVEGKWNSSFGGEQSHRFEPRHYRVARGTIHPEVIESLAGGAGLRAPAAFGAFGGQSFRPENAGFISSVHWTEGDAQPLPYTTSIIRRDADGTEHVFVSNVQAGQNLIGFASDRMIVTNMGHSYSSGNFKHPDGTVFTVRPKR